MPRKARIDAPGALHHVIVRGIERGKIFRSDYDRKNFLKGFSMANDPILSVADYYGVLAAGRFSKSFGKSASDSREMSAY